MQIASPGSNWWFSLSSSSPHTSPNFINLFLICWLSVKLWIRTTCCYCCQSAQLPKLFSRCQPLPPHSVLARTLPSFPWVWAVWMVTGRWHCNLTVFLSQNNALYKNSQKGLPDIIVNGLHAGWWNNAKINCRDSDILILGSVMRSIDQTRTTFEPDAGFWLWTLFVSFVCFFICTYPLPSRTAARSPAAGWTAWRTCCCHSPGCSLPTSHWDSAAGTSWR